MGASSNPLRRATRSQSARLRAVARMQRTGGRIQQAVETLRVAAVLRPRDIEVWDELAATLDAAGDVAGAQSSRKIADALRRMET